MFKHGFYSSHNLCFSFLKICVIIFQIKFEAGYRSTELTALQMLTLKWKRKTIPLKFPEAKKNKLQIR